MRNCCDEKWGAVMFTSGEMFCGLGCAALGIPLSTLAVVMVLRGFNELFFRGCNKRLDRADDKIQSLGMFITGVAWFLLLVVIVLAFCGVVW
jgi:hypothetical protein